MSDLLWGSLVNTDGLRIAHFVIGRCNPDSANGIDKTVYYLSKSQAELGHQVLVCSLTDKPPIPIPGAQVRAYPPNKIVPFVRARPVKSVLETRSPLSVPRDLISDLLEWEPAVLHLHFVQVPQNLLLASRARRRGIPYCVTIHGGLSPVAQRRNRWVKLVFKILFERRYLHRAAFLHAVSQHDVRGLEAYGVKHVTTVVPNGMDLSSIPGVDGVGGLRAQFAELARKRIFLFLGRLDAEQKGLDLLLRAFAQAQTDAAALVVAGPDWGGNRLRLERAAQELGISSAVYFTGSVFGPQKFAFLADADVFVHPSRWEAGVPFSVLEAAAMRKPCLFTPEADASGIMSRYGAGIAVQPDAASISAGIRQFMTTDTSALEAMGERARSMIEAEFNWRPIAQRIVNSYRTYAVRLQR
jgi:glycosyltransferase involved in cell wall biosynthesis